MKEAHALSPAPDAAAVIGGLNWYRAQFRRAMKLALALTVALCASLGFAAILLLNQPKPQYFAATPDLRLAPMVPLDQPLLTQEGLLTGDKFLAIALHENYLFAYTEEPRGMTSIRRDLSQPSQAIRDWIAVHPMEHFQPWQADPKDHFQTLDTLLLLHQ